LYNWVSCLSAPLPKRRSEKRSVRRAPPRLDQFFLHRPGGSGVSDPSYKRPAYETATRRPSRRCSRVRWPRFPHLAVRPHPSKHGYETAFTHPVHSSKFVRRDVRCRDRGQRPTATEDPHTKRPRGGQAATVAGDVDPGFRTWPSGHIPQNTDTKPLLHIRSTAQNSFGETFGAATGVSDPRLQKTRIRNGHAAAKPPL
jgi:hypothetical protein